MNDPVHSPSHYADGGIECIDAMRSAFHPSEVAAFCKLNAFKYIWRAGKKGDTVEDLEKAQVYLGWTIDATREDEPVPEAKSMQCDEEHCYCPELGVCRHEARLNAQRSYREGMERAAGRLHGSVSDVYLDGERVPGVLAISFETKHTDPEWCGVEDVASVGSLHEAPTDSPHRGADRSRPAGSCPPPLRGASGH